MMLFRISIYARKGLLTFFPLFLCLNTIFCNSTRVNNLFHICILCLLIMLASNIKLRHVLFSDYRFNFGFLLIILMLVYFCLTILWSPHSNTIISYLTHSFYILQFILIFQVINLQGKRLIAFWSMAIGIVILVVLTFITVDFKSIVYNRLTNGFFAAPSNIIDLGGYFSLGIFICLILIRDTGIRWIYLPITFLLLALLLTQSRGPLLSLLCSLGILSILQLKITKRYTLAIVLIGLVMPTLLFTSSFGTIFLRRIVNAYQQSFIRIDIWRHTLELAAIKPFFGWGLDKQLSFVNMLGDTITTTHSLYLSSLLKGGACGIILFIMVIIYGLLMAKRQFNYHLQLEGALFLFVTQFYLTQGMEIISNPNVSWNMFWFPLAVVITPPVHTHRTNTSRFFKKY